MALMTAQPPLPIAPVVGVEIGATVVLVEDADGGRVFLHGNLAYGWDDGDQTGRRLAAVQLVECGARRWLRWRPGSGLARSLCGGGVRRGPTAGWPGWCLPGPARGGPAPELDLFSAPAP